MVRQIQLSNLYVGQIQPLAQMQSEEKNSPRLHANKIRENGDLKVLRFEIGTGEPEQVDVFRILQDFFDDLVYVNDLSQVLLKSTW